MILPSLPSSAKSALGSTLIGRLLGTSDKSDESEEAPQQLKFRLGEEPRTPRAGSPGFQDGHWVIARPKLATPTIYQHARSPTNDHSALGLGATTPPRDRWSLRENSRSSPSVWAEWGNESWEQDAPRGSIVAWEGEEGHHDGEQNGQFPNGGQVHDEDEYDRCEEVEGEQGRKDSQELDETPGVVDIPALDKVGPYVNDVYYAVAHPRFAVDPICIRRQRENACAAAGALTNTLRRVDRSTNQLPRPTDKVGQERAEALELGARMLMRSLDKDFPACMRTRAAAALHRVLTFQDVRTRVEDVAPSTVAPLVRLLRQDGSSEKHGQLAGDTAQTSAAKSSSEATSRETELRRPQQLRRNGEHMHPEDHGRRHSKEQPHGGRASERGEGAEASKTWCQNVNKAPLHAAACLRVLALTEGLPEVLSSNSAIPALVDGLKSGSPPMKSICGGCLASMAPCDEEGCSEMLDFGLLPPLIELVRDGNSPLEVTAWGLLAAIMHAQEARQAFLRAGGLEDLERMLVRKRSRTASNRFLLASQENAMRVLLRLCEEQEQDEERANSQATDPTIPSILLLDDNKDDRGSESSTSNDAADRAAAAHEKGDNNRKAGGRGRREPDAKARTLPPSSPKPEVEDELGSFVAKEPVFQAVLRQMRGGTSISKETAAKVLEGTWKACSRRQVDLTMPPVLQMLESNVWVLKSAAAQVILHVYLEDEQRLRCAVSGGVRWLLETIRTRAPQMQAGTLSALLSLCEHPDVPAVIVEAGGLSVLAEHLTTARDVATRYVVLAIMKVILVCERPSVEPFLPDMLVSEHVLGASDDIDEFVGAFVEKRKASDYLRVRAANVCRFAASDIAEYKATFKKLDKDASGALDERELGMLLKQLKVDSRKKTVRKVLLAVDKNNSGTIEFDEFLDIMWDVKHAKGRARGLLFSHAGVFLEGTLAAAQAALLSKRLQMGGLLLSHPHDTPAEGKSIASHDSHHSHATNLTTSSTASGQHQPEEQEQPTQQRVLVQRRHLTTMTFSAAMTRGKEAALSVLPKLSGKTTKWRGFS